MIIDILFFFLIPVLFLFLCYLFFLSLKKIRQYENFIIQFSQIVEYSTEKMKQVDASGHYEADDETGFFFQELKTIQLLLNNIFEPEDLDAEKITEEKQEDVL